MDLTEEIEKLRVRCIGCAKCSNVCPSMEKGGMDPMEIMMGGEADLSLCITCGNCTRVCHRTDPGAVIKDLIAMENDIHVSQMFRDTGFVMPRAELSPEPEWSGDDVMVMLGCTVRSLTPYVPHAMASAMRAMGVGARELPEETCCLHPTQFREMKEIERRSYRTAMGRAAGGKGIVALCPGCSEELNGSGVDAVHAIQFLAANTERLPRFDRPIRVAMEPGCSAMPYRKDMRAVLEAMGCTVTNREYGCCGKRNPLASELMEDRMRECAGADLIVVGCPLCLDRYDHYEGGKPVVHIVELVAMAAGDSRSLGGHVIPIPEI